MLSFNEIEELIMTTAINFNTGLAFTEEELQGMKAMAFIVKPQLDQMIIEVKAAKSKHPDVQDAIDEAASAIKSVKGAGLELPANFVEAQVLMISLLEKKIIDIDDQVTEDEYDYLISYLSGIADCCV